MTHGGGEGSEIVLKISTYFFNGPLYQFDIVKIYSLEFITFTIELSK